MKVVVAFILALNAAFMDENESAYSCVVEVMKEVYSVKMSVDTSKMML
jgi:hypothetical protein